MNDLGNFPPWPDAMREASMVETIASAPVDECIWEFGYGSLMWDPRFQYRCRQHATLRGYRRSFCFWSVRGRGSPEAPGLGLALLEGATHTHGMAFRLEPDHFATDLPALWKREMVNGVYRPVWVPIEMHGDEALALTFVADPDHPQFAGEFPADVQADYIRQATGIRGRCRDYLANVVAGLHDLGVPDSELDDLLARVDKDT